jgi:hypothetical protein
MKLSVAATVTAGIVTIGATLDGRATVSAPAPTLNATPMIASAVPPRSISRQAFSITWARTVTSPDGQSQLLLTSKQDVRADGAFKLVHTFHDRDGVAASRSETYFGLMNLGTFRLDEVRHLLVFAAPILDEGVAEVEAYLREQPQYDREEDVFGQRTLVWRIPHEDKRGYTEEYRAPALGGLLIKRVRQSPRGREVFEPTEIMLGEPSPTLFAEFSQYAVDYSDFERRVQQTERRGGKEAAKAMRAALRRIKEARHNIR